MNNKWILIGIGVIAIVVVAGGGFYFLNNNSTSNNTSSQDSLSEPTIEPTSVPQESEAMTENEIIVEGGEFKFTPSTVTVKKGEKVKLIFKNTGKFPHDFIIADLNVATERIQPGQEDTVEFIPDKTGEFKFICDVGNHEEQGMTGILIVE